jgi:hypothetical protein
MRLQDLLETTQDDRAISSLSDKVYNFLRTNYASDVPFERDDPNGTFTVGKLGDLIDLTVEEQPFKEINLIIQSDESIRRTISPTDPTADRDPYNPRVIIGAWNPKTDSTHYNVDFFSSTKLRTTIAHELRHALDDLKSDYRANASVRYETPRKKGHRVSKSAEDRTPYLAQPAEINARAMEVQHQLTNYIPRIYAKFDEDQIRPKVVAYIKRLMQEYRIADLFPERSQSPQYKQLVKRIVLFAQSVMADVETKTGKIARGNW